MSDAADMTKTNAGVVHVAVTERRVTIQVIAESNFTAMLRDGWKMSTDASGNKYLAVR